MLRSIPVTLSHFPPNSGTPLPSRLAQIVSLFQGKAGGSGTSHPGSIKMPASLAPLPRHGCERGLVFKVYGRCRGLLCAGGRKAGRDVVGCLLSVQGAAQCACIPAGLEPRACVYPGFLLRMGNLGIAASHGLKSRTSISADKSASCV